MVESENKSSRTDLRDLILESTIHGLPHIFRSKHLLQKIAWSIFFFIALGSVFYFIIINILDYTEYPVITNVYKLVEHRAEFPTVTFCFATFFSIVPINATCHFDDKICDPENFRNKNEMCYEFNRGFSVSIDSLTKKKKLTSVDVVNSTKPGVHHGLRVILENPVKDYYFRIYINNYKKNIVGHSDIKSSFGVEIDLIISRSILNKLDQPYSDCKKEIRFELNGTERYFQYFQSECFILCRQAEIAKACNLTGDFERNKHYYYTNIVHFFDIGLYKTCDEKKLFSVEDMFAKKGEIEMCGAMCPIECSSVLYTIEPRYNFKNTPSEKRKAYVNVYYANFDLSIFEEIAKFEPVDLFGSIGGYFGKIKIEQKFRINFLVNVIKLQRPASWFERVKFW